MSDWDNFTNWWSQVRQWWSTPMGGQATSDQQRLENIGNIMSAQTGGSGVPGDRLQALIPPPAPTAGSPSTASGSGSPGDLASLYKALFASGAGASGGSGSPAGYYTPDGVWINDNSPQDAYYRMVDAIWTKIYGQHPPFSMVQTFRDLGVENTSQLDTIMKQMPSHISNPDGSKMPIGQYDVIKGTAESFSDKYFGRPIPDSLIQDWAKQGITDPESIELWFLNHPAKDIPKDVYGKIFDAASAQVKKTWNDLPHPNTVAAIHQTLAQSGGTGATYLP